MLGLLREEIGSALNGTVGLSQHLTARRICKALYAERLDLGGGRNRPSVWIRGHLLIREKCSHDIGFNYLARIPGDVVDMFYRLIVESLGRIMVHT